jgi:hypothetical protein
VELAQTELQVTQGFVDYQVIAGIHQRQVTLDTVQQVDTRVFVDCRATAGFAVSRVTQDSPVNLVIADSAGYQGIQGFAD